MPEQPVKLENPTPGPRRHHGFGPHDQVIHRLNGLKIQLELLRSEMQVEFAAIKRALEHQPQL